MNSWQCTAGLWPTRIFILLDFYTSSIHVYIPGQYHYFVIIRVLLLPRVDPVKVVVIRNSCANSSQWRYVITHFYYNRFFLHQKLMGLTAYPAALLYIRFSLQPSAPAPLCSLTTFLLFSQPLCVCLLPCWGRCSSNFPPAILSPLGHLGLFPFRPLHALAQTSESTKPLLAQTYVGSEGAYLCNTARLPTLVWLSQWEGE